MANLNQLDSRNLIEYFALCGLDTQSKSGLESEPNESYEETPVKPPLERSYKCKILYHFPENLPWNPFDEDAVTQLCFPNGLVFQKHSSRPNYHPFIITREDGSRVYGATLQFYELIEDESICGAMQTLQTMYDAELVSSSLPATAVTSSASILSSNTNRVYTRSATANVSGTDLNRTVGSDGSFHVSGSRSSRNSSMSHKQSPVSARSEFITADSLDLENEFSQLCNTENNESFSGRQSSGHNLNKSRNGSNHYQHHNHHNNNVPHSPTKVSHYNMLKDRLYACKCICLISQQPFNRAFAKILHTLYDMVERTDLLGIPLEAHLHNLVYDLPMPMPGQLVKIHIGCKASYVLAPLANDLPLFDYDLLEFFRLLGVHNALNLYITALLEHQILLYSKNYNLLMLVAESLTTLLFPFQWVKTYVPIVPASNLHFIEAPLPYIMGFHHKDIDKDFFKQGQRCFVDIDSGTVSCPEGLPEFPDKNKFIKEINDLLVHFHEKRNRLRAAASLGVSVGASSVSSVAKTGDATTGEQLRASSDNVHGDNMDILQNSQAFARIAELALKAGAFDSNPDYLTESSIVGQRLKSVNSKIAFGNNVNSETSSGYSSESNTNIPTTSITGSTSTLGTSSPDRGVTLAAVNSRESSRRNSSQQIGGFIDEEDIISAQFNACIRELFLLKFVQMFVSYEKFVIVPSNVDAAQIDQWWMQREYSGVNFDSKMFLIEQPSPRLPFLSHFLSTQLFVSFIDSKIISIIDPSSRVNSEYLGVRLFDERIRTYRQANSATETSFLDLTTASSNSSSSKIDPNASCSASTSRNLFNVENIEKEVSKRFNQDPIIAPSVKPNEMVGTRVKDQHQSGDEKRANCHYLFENVDTKLLKADEEAIKRIHAEMKLKKETWLKNREQFRSSQLKLNGLERHKTTKERKTRKNTEARQKKSTPVIISSESSEKTTEINPIFIQSLLKESKLKTKRMLVEKMPEAANLGHGEARISGVEENMLIASLCDLIERIWGHGLHNKAGKSALWNHLSNYRKLIQYLHPNSHLVADPKTTSPTLLWCLMKKRALVASSYGVVTNSTSSSKTNVNKLSVEKSGLHLVDSSRNRSPGSCTLPRKRNMLGTHLFEEGKLLSPNLSIYRHHGSTANLSNGSQHSSGQKPHKRASSVSNPEQQENTFPPLKNDLLADLARIDKLTEVKTEIGMARAFVRLSLEKKLLADHLRQLMSEAELLRALYKKHAFLRQEEEREQFIYHLQSLNVVDYFCFTDHFKSIPTDYSVLIVQSKKFNSSYTSANPYMKLFGSLGESDVFAIPKNTFEFIISCKNNLGSLTTLVVGHDNAGITPKWMIECVFVRNEITGHIHKFPCGRWLGKGVDDDSLERVLIAEPLDHNETYDLPNIQLLSPYSSNTSRSRSPTIIRYDEKKLPASAIQELLGNAINTLVKYFEKSEPERGSLTSLMCGENGLVSSMDYVFSFGYKSFKLFKRLYVWDFFEKAATEYESLLYSNYINSINHDRSGKSLSIEKLVKVIRSINSTSSNYGKDGRFQIFICLACRDSFLSEWFSFLSKSNTASQMYDEYSFLRNHELNKFCMKLLSITNQFNFKLENSLTMGINY